MTMRCNAIYFAPKPDTFGLAVISPALHVVMCRFVFCEKKQFDPIRIGLILLVLIIGGTCGRPVVALEKCPVRPDADADAQALAGQWFSKGSEMVAKGDYTDGRDAFLCSHQLFPHPASLLNAGLASQKANDWVRACLLYQQFIAVANQPDKTALVRGEMAVLDCDHIATVKNVMPVPVADGTTEDSATDAVPGTDTDQIHPSLANTLPGAPDENSAGAELSSDTSGEQRVPNDDSEAMALAHGKSHTDATRTQLTATVSGPPAPGGTGDFGVHPDPQVHTVNFANLKIGSVILIVSGGTAVVTSVIF